MTEMQSFGRWYGRELGAVFRCGSPRRSVYTGSVVKVGPDWPNKCPDGHGQQPCSVSVQWRLKHTPTALKAATLHSRCKGPPTFVSEHNMLIADHAFLLHPGFSHLSCFSFRKGCPRTQALCGWVGWHSLSFVCADFHSSPAREVVQKL